ncbi:MAG: leucyl/phenylalanyl-tRNA--protein transferase [Flavobacteriales bacterium]|nr:leucyl/phenylalanyl-tRNA--protein transferase [Flavobacteriales bacterium]
MSLIGANVALGAEDLRLLYRQGWFPMAESNGELYLHRPDRRAVFNLDALRPDDTTSRQLRTGRFTITVDRCFEEVMRRCADREETWIDERLIAAYTDLHRLGDAHSVEVWRDGGLVGGIYGVALGGAFFGESLFGMNNAGKAAFHALVARLREGGYVLFDSQYINDFTRSLGAFEIDAADFNRQLQRALSQEARFPCA